MYSLCHDEDHLLIEHYEATDQCLGDGKNGDIKTVICKATGKEFALKTLDMTRAKFSNVMAEVNALEVGSGYENIVHLNEVIKVNHFVYVVMEKLNGGDLLDYIVRKGQVDESIAAKVIKDVTGALGFLHSHGIAHRDVKPENIFCNGKDDIFPVKLGDFDLATNPSKASCCKDHENDLFSDPVGSEYYMAPEVASVFLRGDGHYTKQCDMWSLGVILYTMLHSDIPFYSTMGVNCTCINDNRQCEYCFDNTLINIMKGKFNIWNKKLSEGAKDLLRNLLKVDPNERYTAAQVLEHSWIKTYCN